MDNPLHPPLSGLSTKKRFFGGLPKGKVEILIFVWPSVHRKELVLMYKEPKRGWKVFLILILERVFKSHACAPSCIASQNHSRKKLKIQIADGKQFKIVPGTIYCCIVIVYNL